MKCAAFLVVLLLVALPAGYAANQRFSQPPEGVTGHTVFAKHIKLDDDRDGKGLPTDFAAVAGYFAVHEPTLPARQRECVVWFDGKSLDQRPDPDPRFNGGPGGSNDFPSDEDQGVPRNPAAQDYDFDRDVAACPPHAAPGNGTQHGMFSAVVESGDCDPRLGRDHTFRGHLDFVDPNGVYHEVQEYTYVCGFGGPGNMVPNPAFPGGGGLSEALRDLLPAWPFPGDRPCGEVDPFWEEIDPENGSFGDPEGTVACNPRIQALFTETLWISPIHAPVWDPTVQDLYNFAVQIDTCDGSGCTDGSRDSFDDTSRGRVDHRAAPEDEEAVMRGNSYDSDPQSSTFGKHRTNCRSALVEWKQVRLRPAPGQEDCYPEDHRTAQVDVYVFDHDPTGGLWAANSNGMTGQNTYVGHPSTGPTWGL